MSENDDKQDDLEGGGHNLGLSPEVFLQHFRTVSARKREAAQANSALQLALKKAKAAGVDLDVLRGILASRKLEPAVVEQRTRDLFRYGSWLGMSFAAQPSLFPASDDAPKPSERAVGEQREWEQEEDGFTAGSAGRAHDDNPNPPGSALHQAWARGHSRGVEFIKEGLRTGRVRDPAEAKKAKGSGSSGGRSRGGPGRKRRTSSASA